MQSLNLINHASLSSQLDLKPVNLTATAYKLTAFLDKVSTSTIPTLFQVIVSKVSTSTLPTLSTIPTLCQVIVSKVSTSTIPTLCQVIVSKVSTSTIPTLPSYCIIPTFSKPAGLEIPAHPSPIECMLTLVVPFPTTQKKEHQTDQWKPTYTV